MLDLNTLHIFTPKNGIYGGVNKPNFKSIELWIQTIKEAVDQPITKANVLGLFGPASTGKTSTAKVIAKSLHQPLVTINCAALDQANFWQSIFTHTEQLYPGSRIHDYMTVERKKVYMLQQCVVLLDECHELSNRAQGQLLSVLDGSINPVNGAINKENPLLLKQLTWVFSTTDSGKLLYPLSTRLHSVVLNEYSENDVVEIVKLGFPVLSDGAALVLSRAAKLVPRIALDLAKQYISIFRNSCYTRETALSYVNSIKQTNEYGLDFTDKLIMDMLKDSKVSLPKAKQLEKNLLVKKLTKFDVLVNPSEEQLTEAINLQTQLESFELQELESSNMARSRQDISTFCRLYDMRDLEMRLGYMEKLGVIARTKSGVLWKRDVE
jgi:Holliday junction resolvasome RuvABC ATP-dependent DNA helicase subunit